MSREPEVLDRLRGALARDRAQDRAAKRGAEDAETLERLRALGYIASASAAPEKDVYTADGDPKNLIDFDGRNRAALSAFMNGDIDKAIDLARKNLRLRPDMAGMNLELAYLERARGNLSAAIVAAQKSVALKPLETEGLSLLAAYLTEAGRAREAVALLEPHRKANRADFDVLTALGLAHAALRQADAARAAFEQARRAEPQNALGEVNLGTLSLMTGDRAAARRAMTVALAMDPGVAKAHNILGVMEAQEGRPEEAIAHWRLAAGLNPQDYQTLFNLGKTLDQAGSPVGGGGFLQSIP